MRRVAILALLVVLVGTACQRPWAQAGFDAGRGGRNASDEVLTLDRVAAGLDEQWTADLGAGWAAGFDDPVPVAPVVTASTVYAVGGDPDTDGWALLAFDRSPGDACDLGTPRTCAPRWLGALGGVPSGLAVSGDRVVVTVTGHFRTVGCAVGADGTGASTSQADCVPPEPPGVQVFDAPACSATLDGRCDPAWQQADEVIGQPLVVDGQVVVVEQHPVTPGSYERDLRLAAYDVVADASCVGGTTACQPRWTAPLAQPDASPLTPIEASPSPALGGGLVLVVDSTGLVGFDPAGAAGCAGTPTACTPVLRADLGFAPATLAGVSVIGGTAYVVAGDGLLEGGASADLSSMVAIDLAGCPAAPATCAPAWATGPLTDTAGAHAVEVGEDVIAVAGTGGVGLFRPSACAVDPTSSSCLFATYGPRNALSGPLGASAEVLFSGGAPIVLGADGSEWGVQAIDPAATPTCEPLPEAGYERCWFDPLWTALPGAHVSADPVPAFGALHVVDDAHVLHVFG